MRAELSPCLASAVPPLRARRLKKAFVPRMLAFFAVLLLCLCAFVRPAHADVIEGSADWQVTFTGAEMEETYDSGKFNDVLSGLQPGDTAKFQVTLANEADFNTNWYMENAVIKSLEETQSAAENGFYTYRLTYEGPDGVESVLFASDAVGGSTEEGLEGLHQATDALKDFFYLGMLKPKETGRVSLTVALDGETEGNEYQDSLAQLQMRFAAERDQGEVTGTPGTVTTTETAGAPGTGIDTFVQLVQTGDFWIAVAFYLAAFGAGIAVLIVAVRRSGRERRGGHEQA